MAPDAEAGLAHADFALTRCLHAQRNRRTLTCSAFVQDVLEEDEFFHDPIINNQAAAHVNGAAVLRVFRANLPLRAGWLRSSAPPTPALDMPEPACRARLSSLGRLSSVVACCAHS